MKNCLKRTKSYISGVLIVLLLMGMLGENTSVVYASQTISWVVKPKYNYDDIQPIVDIYRQETINNDLGNFEARAFYIKDGKAGLTDYYGNNIIDCSLDAYWHTYPRSGTGVYASGKCYNVNGREGLYAFGGGGVWFAYWNELENNFVSIGTSVSVIDSFSSEKICAVQCVEYDSVKGYYSNDPTKLVKFIPKYRLVGTDGKFISAKKFDEIKTDNMCMQDYIVGDYAVVKENGKWGYMKLNGKYLLKPQYEDAYPFVDGIAAVKKNGKAGFIKEDGTTVTDFVFEETRSIYEGKAWVKYNGKWGVVNVAKMAGIKLENNYTADKMKNAALEAIEYYLWTEKSKKFTPDVISFIDYDMDGKLELFLSNMNETGAIQGYILRYEKGHYYFWDEFSFGKGKQEKFNVVYVNNKKEYIFLQEHVDSSFSESFASVGIYNVKQHLYTELVGRIEDTINNQTIFYLGGKEINKTEYNKIISEALKGYKKVDSTYKFVNLIEGKYAENIEEAWNAYSIEGKKTSKSVTKVKKLTQAKKYSENSITMTWNKCKNVKGYEIYRATSKNGKYKKIKTTTSTKYKDVKLSSGKTYYYKVRAYNVVSGKKLYGKFSDIKAMGTKPKTPSIKVSAGKNEAKVTWKKISRVSGYDVYMSTRKNGTYRKTKTLEAKKTSCLKTGLKKGNKYYFKIRSYRKVVGKKFYSSWSTVKSVKIK